MQQSDRTGQYFTNTRRAATSLFVRVLIHSFVDHGRAGWVDQMGGMWTEQYAGRLLSAATQSIINDERWSGIGRCLTGMERERKGHACTVSAN